MGSLSKPVDSLSLGGGSAVSLLLVMGRKEESLVTLGTGTKGGLLRMFKHPSLDNPTLPAPLLPSLGKSAVPKRNLPLQAPIPSLSLVPKGLTLRPTAISITRELVRNLDSWVLPKPTESETLGGELCNLCSCKASIDSGAETYCTEALESKAEEKGLSSSPFLEHSSLSKLEAF